MGKNDFKKLNDEILINKREEHFELLKKIYAGIEPKTIFSINGFVNSGTLNPYEEPELWVEENLKILDENAGILMDDKVFRPICIEFGLYGVHFIDKILGAEVFFRDGQWYNEYLDSPIGELEPPDLKNNKTWSLAKRTAKAFTESRAKLPLFGLPTIASTINIAVNLYGQEILSDMYLNPEKAIHDFELINRLLCTLHQWYINNIPCEQLQPVISWERTQPRGFGQLCGCSNQLVSPHLYNEFLASLDDKLLSVYPNGGMIHLCGSHEQHIPTWRDMKSLRAIQVNDRAAEDLVLYFKELREDQMIYLTPCEVMSAERAVEITGGHRLIIQGALDTPMRTTNRHF